MVCWSCSQPGGEMLHFGGIHIHDKPSCRAIAGIPEEDHNGSLDARSNATVKIDEYPYVVIASRGHEDEEAKYYDETVCLTPAQFLSLLEWGAQNKLEIERLAREQSDV